MGKYAQAPKEFKKILKEYSINKFVQQQRSARARVNAHTCANCAENMIIKHKIITLCNVSITYK